LPPTVESLKSRMSLSLSGRRGGRCWADPVCRLHFYVNEVCAGINGPKELLRILRHAPFGNSLIDIARELLLSPEMP
jgi:hypothetical protein